MNDNSNYYDSEKKRKPWLKIFLFLIGFVVIIVLIFLCLKGCQRKDLYSPLLAGGKEYFQYEDRRLPDSIGECKEIELKELLSNGMIVNPEQYNECDTEQTYVKVCKLESGGYQYTPVISCGENITQFSNWSDGTEKDLIQGNSDLQFTFIGEIGETGLKNYYPNNLTESAKVKEYYTVAPSNDYKEKDSETSQAAKWYTEKSGDIYWNKGEFSATMPTGYPKKGEQSSKVYYLSNKPATTDYRTISSELYYKIEKVSYPRFTCKTNTDKSAEIDSNIICSNRDDSFKTVKGLYYTCGNKNENGDFVRVEKGTICSQKDWTTASCKAANQTEKNTKDGINYSRDLLTGITCYEGYKITDKTYKWYKKGEVRIYYPSGKENVDEENTYYVTSPIEGAIKDINTITKAYKFYKLNTDTAGTDIKWTPISEEYQTFDEMITKFKELSFEVETFDDIKSNKDIRYQVNMEYRNRD